MKANEQIKKFFGMHNFAVLTIAATTMIFPIKETIAMTKNTKTKMNVSERWISCSTSPWHPYSSVVMLTDLIFLLILIYYEVILSQFWVY